jgi:hypothetical protein
VLGRLFDGLGENSRFSMQPAAEATQICCFGYMRSFGTLTIEAHGAGQGKCLWPAVVYQFEKS